jgi:hypothetical protein
MIPGHTLEHESEKLEGARTLIDSSETERIVQIIKWLAWLFAFAAGALITCQVGSNSQLKKLG